MSEAERLSTPESAELQSLPIAVGTPVHMVKVDPATLQAPHFFGGIVGGFVHASVGQCAYVYNPACEVHQEGQVFYTAKTSRISRMQLHAGTYYLQTASGSVYMVVMNDGPPIVHPNQVMPVQLPTIASVADASQPPIQRSELLGAAELSSAPVDTAPVQSSLRATLAWLLTLGKKKG